MSRLIWLYLCLSIGYKKLSILNSTEREILIAHKTKMLKMKYVLALKLLNVVSILLIDVKMPTIVGIFTAVGILIFMSSIKGFAIIRVGHEKSCSTSGQGLTPSCNECLLINLSNEGQTLIIMTRA